MPQRLGDKNIMILVSSGVDEIVMSNVQREILRTGANIKIVSTDNGLVNSWNGKTWGLYFPVDANVNTTLGADFDMLVVPSGRLAVEKLSTNPHSERIISSFFEAGKPMFFFGDAAVLIKDVDHGKYGDIISTGEVGSELSSSVFSMIMHFADSVIDRADKVKKVA